MREQWCRIERDRHHLLLRTQFDQPIGSFQAIKHKCADMAIAAEMAWAQTTYAALALHEARADAPFQATAAKAVAGRGAVNNASTNIQVHGGIGFTEDHHAHRFLKRARLLDLASGTLRQRKDFLMAQPAPMH